MTPRQKGRPDDDTRQFQKKEDGEDSRKGGGRQSDYYSKGVDRPRRVADKWYQGEQKKFEAGRAGWISGTWLGMIPGRPLDRSEHREQLVMVGGDVSPGCLLFPRQEICIRKMHAPIELVVGIRLAIFFASYR